MNRLALTLLTAGIGVTFALHPVFAANPASAKKTEPTTTTSAASTPTQIPMSTVLQNLQMNGYDIVSKIELDNGVFAIDALTPQGKAVSVLMKAQTGEITQPKQNPAPHISLDDAVKKVEAAGYHDLFKVEYSGTQYIVRAYDQKNKKVKLKVNGNTGDISTSWF